MSFLTHGSLLVPISLLLLPTPYQQGSEDFTKSSWWQTYFHPDRGLTGYSQQYRSGHLSMYHYSSSTVPSPKRYAFCLPTLHRDSGGKHRASVVTAVLTWSTAVSTAACAQGPGFLPHLSPAVSLRTTQDKRSSIPRRRKPSQKEQAVSVQQEQPCGGRLGWRCCGREADGADKPTACLHKSPAA